MQQIFIELYNYRASWHALPAVERRRCADLILADAQGLTKHGVELIGWGMSLSPIALLDANIKLSKPETQKTVS